MLIKHLKKIFDLYIFLNIHVALSVLALYFIFHHQWNQNYAWFLFTSTVLSYGIIRLIDVSSNRDIFKSYFYAYRLLFYIVLLLSFLFALGFFLKLNFLTQLLIIPLTIITLTYQTILRRNGIVKILTVAGVWASMIVLLPIEHLKDFDRKLLLHFIYVFLYVLMLTLSFDQRDVLIDAPELKTLAQRFPHKKLLIYFTLLTVFLSMNSFIFTNTRSYLVSNFMILISLVLCFSSKQEKSFYFTAFWIEALPIFWYLILKI